MHKVLFLGCNDDQLPYLKELKLLPFEIIGTDINDNAPGKGLCDNFYSVGYDNLEQLVAIGRENGFTSKDKVFTASSQFAHKGAAHFASIFDIVYPSESTIDICLDKALFYKHFQKLGMPIPETVFIENREGFENFLLSLDNSTAYYLKSDFSKNPNYIYRFTRENIKPEEIFWGRDRHLQNCYILQKEVKGKSLRINIYGNRFNIFDFDSMSKLNVLKNDLVNVGVINSLQSFIDDQSLNNWLVKFDIILDDTKFVVLDVGLDPPYRMVKEANLQQINFSKYYIAQYLYNQVDYPQTLD